MQYNAMQCNAMQCNAMQCNAMHRTAADRAALYFLCIAWRVICEPAQQRIACSVNIHLDKNTPANNASPRL